MNQLLELISGESHAHKHKEKDRKKITDYWDYDYNENLKKDEQIQSYFENVKILKKQKEKLDYQEDLKEVLIVQVESIKSPEIEKIIDNIDKIRVSHFMPLTLFLVKDGNINIDKGIFEKYGNVEPRIIKFARFTKKERKGESFKKEIFEDIILRFCSIHNELGEIFQVKEENNENNEECFDLIDGTFLFNINICCMGRFGMGKSTGVNSILREYKAKESGKAVSQTKNITIYQVRDVPIRVYDIPGFESLETVGKAIERLKICSESVNSLKESIHEILLFIKYTEDRVFSEIEKPLFAEVCKLKSTKLIYVVTHCTPEMTENDKNDFMANINEGVNDMKLNDAKFNATEKNIVFLNFHYYKKYKINKFGEDQLFKIICDNFKESDAYKKVAEIKLEDELEILRTKAYEIVKVNKILGGVVGAVPLLDMVLQKYLIKKNAIDKLGNLFEIDIKYVEAISSNNNELMVSKIEELKEKKEVDNEELNTFNTPEKVNSTLINTSKVLSLSDDVARLVSGAVSTGAKASCFLVSSAIGIGTGYYFTKQFCDDLIEKFIDFRRNNHVKQKNCYELAFKYFLGK